MLDKEDSLLFYDEAGVSLEPTLRSQWALKGHQPQLPTESRRKRVNLGGWINPIENTVAVRKTEKGNSENFLRVLTEIESQYRDKRRIIVVLDNARWHKSNLVKECLKKHFQIIFWFLPRYSPELNIQEIQWRYLRQKSTHCHRFENEEECWQSIKSHFEQLTPERISSLCQYN